MNKPKQGLSNGAFGGSKPKFSMTTPVNRMGWSVVFPKSANFKGVIINDGVRQSTNPLLKAKK